MPKTRPEFWIAKFQGTVRRDEQKRDELEKAGWRVVVVWECDLRKTPHETLKSVENQLITQQ
jgi:DNA mismatch endonuclease (patch repair protein)